MLLPGAEALGLTHSQCLGLLESADDALDFLNASLAYLIHAESQLAQPGFELIAEWKALGQEVFEGAACAARFGCRDLSAGHQDLCSAQP
ncbi:hypothetical protein ACU8WE_18560 [Pseudomonas parakoreensis]